MNNIDQLLLRISELERENKELQDELIAEHQACVDMWSQRDKWKEEYENVCKFANDYEQQRDDLRTKLLASENRNTVLKETLVELREVILGSTNSWTLKEKIHDSELKLDCYERAYAWSIGESVDKDTILWWLKEKMKQHESLLKELNNELKDVK